MGRRGTGRSDRSRHATGRRGTAYTEQATARAGAGGVVCSGLAGALLVPDGRPSCWGLAG